MPKTYRKHVLLSEFEWEDITDKLTWKEEEGVMCGYGEKPTYPLVVKGKKSSYMKISPMFITCGKGTFLMFGHGTYWLTAVNGKQRLLFLSKDAGALNLKEYGVHGC